MGGKRWTTERIGDQSGRVAIVTGGNSGIGYETAKALADRHFDVAYSSPYGRALQTAESVLAGRARIGSSES